MPTIRVALQEAHQGIGRDGQWWIDLSLATEETLLEVLAAIDPDLLVQAGSAAPAVGGGFVDIFTRIAIDGDRLRGFVGTSDRMVVYRVAVTGRDPMYFRTEVAQPATPILLPGSFALSAGQTVVVAAKNESDQGVADAAACIFWRNNA